MTAWRDTPISIADDLFLVALDERTGRVRLHPRALSLGLAAALLAELAMLNHIAYADGRLTVTVSTGRPVADHHAAIVSRLTSEPQHQLSTWLEFFGQSAPDEVAALLVKRGFLRKEMSRGLIRTKEIYLASDGSALAWRMLRLANIISKRDVRNWEDGILISLVDATGLAGDVLWHGASGDLDNLRDIVTSVSADPFFHALTSQVSALIAAGVMTQRR